MKKQFNNQPLVSVIMNCFNGEVYLEEAINSVFKQTYNNWELIFWDNRSTDNSSNIFKKYKDKRLKYFLSPNHTVLYEGRNLAIQKASGEFIAFLDTDDIWLTNKLEKQIPLFDDLDVGLVYGNCWLYNKKNIFKKKKIFSKKILSTGKISKSLIKDYKIGLVTMVIRKSFIKNDKEIFNTEYDLLADFDFSIKFSLKHKFDCVQEPIAIYRRHENQLSRKSFSDLVNQLEKWFLNFKISLDKKLLNETKIIESKIEYMKVIKLIYEKKYFRSVLNIIKYPFGLKKIKLIIIFLLPDFLLKNIRDFT